MGSAPFATKRGGAIFVAAAFAGLSAPACNAILGHEEAVPAPADAASAADGAGSDASPAPPSDADAAPETSAPSDAAPDAPAPDGGQLGDSPPDVACAEPWKKPTKTDVTCAPRQAILLDPQLLDTTALSIARTGAGRVAVAYNSKLSADEGILRVAHFTPQTASFQKAILDIAGTQFDSIGPAARIAAGAADVFQLAYQTIPDGEIVYRRLGATPPFTPVQVVATGIGQRGEIGLSLATNGDARIVYYAPGSGGASPGKVSSRLRSEATQQLGAVSDVTVSIVGTGVRGTGQLATLTDPAGTAHLAYHFSQAPGSSAPRYTQFTGQTWTSTKTIDNNDFSGIAGYSVAFALVGQTRYAAYFSRKAGTTTADLRLASWVSVNDAPEITVLDQSIPAEDADAPRFRVAMTSDRFGLLHLAIVRPSTVGMGYVEYRRQTRVGGRVSWLSDIVDDSVLSTSSGDSLVDIVVDEMSRPHIAYYAGATGNVYYATRFDR